MRHRNLGDGLEHLGPPEHMAHVQPQHQIPIVGLGDAVLQLRDPPVGVHFDGVEQLQLIDKQGDLGEGVEIHLARHLGSPAVNGVEHDAYRFGAEPSGQTEMNAAVGLGAVLGAAGGVLQLVAKHARRERQVLGGGLDAQSRG